MTNSPPVAAVLTKINIPYRLFKHPGPIHSLEQAALEREQDTDQIVRSILFRLKKDEYVMVLIAGSRQVSWQTLRRYLGQSRLTMANPEEIAAATGYERGAVTPFGLPQPIRILVDESVFEPDEISIGSGERGTTVIMNSKDLKRALGAVEIADFSE